MRKITNKQILLLTLAALTFISGYAYLRYAYRVTDTLPFVQEIVLVILGTVATILITALLLNQQTAVEIEKEQSIKFLDLKAKTYEQLIGLIEEMSMASHVTQKDITRLQFVTHRLAIFASPPVLNEYQTFLGVISQIAKDGSFSGDSEELAKALGQLTVKIRADLLGEKDSQENYAPNDISQLITQNADDSADISIG